MSVRCITQVLDKSVHSGTHLLMMMVLADHSDDEGISYPSVPTLARKCRMTSRNANYILKALQESRELTVLLNKGPKGANLYRIMLSQLGATQPLKPTSPLKHASETPEARFPSPLKPTSDEPSLNRQDPSCAESEAEDFDAVFNVQSGNPAKGPDKNLDKTYSKGFSQFWDAWPIHDRKSAKGKCFEAWKKSHAESIAEQVIAHVRQINDSADWKRDGGRYIPAPLVYLNRRSWEGAEINVGKSAFASTLMDGAT